MGLAKPPVSTGGRKPSSPQLGLGSGRAVQGQALPRLAMLMLLSAPRGWASAVTAARFVSQSEPRSCSGGAALQWEPELGRACVLPSPCAKMGSTLHRRTAASALKKSQIAPHRHPPCVGLCLQLHSSEQTAGKKI